MTATALLIVLEEVSDVREFPPYSHSIESMDAPSDEFIVELNENPEPAMLYGECFYYRPDFTGKRFSGARLLSITSGYGSTAFLLPQIRLALSDRTGEIRISWNTHGAK